MPKYFQDKVVIVTGSSNGIGRTTAQLFAKKGAKVTLTGRNHEALEESKLELLSVGAGEDSILVVAGDITDERVQQEIVSETVKKWGKLNILVNNAGAASVDGAAIKGFDAPLDYFDYTVNLNTKVALSVSKLAMPHLIKAQGEVVNISSIAGLPFGMIRWPYYAMAKAALDQMTRALALAYIEKGVRVNGINPGMVESKFLVKTGATDNDAANMYNSFAADHNRLPIGRTGKPEDIAEAILFLCNRQKSGFIVGQNLVIDGGSCLVMAAAAQ